MRQPAIPTADPALVTLEQGLVNFTTLLLTSPVLPLQGSVPVGRKQPYTLLKLRGPYIQSLAQYRHFHVSYLFILTRLISPLGILFALCKVGLVDG